MTAPAVLTCCNASAVYGVSGLPNTAMSFFPGMRSLRSCNRLAVMSLACALRPVAFAPG
jgi:hypothetical protein